MSADGVLRSRSLKEVARRLLPRGTRAHRILGGELRGMKIVTSWYDYPAAILGWTERPLVSWFVANVKPGDTWLDIGAHYGYTALVLSRLAGNGGRVFAFEPVLPTAACLARTRATNRLLNLTVIPMALGSQAPLRLLRLGTVRGMADSNLDKTLTPAQDQESLLMSSMDWLWPHLCDGKDAIDGVKIDVQGMELELLQGMSGLIARHRPKLIVEFHAGVDRAAVRTVLAESGYEPRARWTTAAELNGEFNDNESYLFLSRERSST